MFTDNEKANEHFRSSVYYRALASVLRQLAEASSKLADDEAAAAVAAVTPDAPDAWKQNRRETRALYCQHRELTEQTATLVQKSGAQHFAQNGIELGLAYFFGGIIAAGLPREFAARALVDMPWEAGKSPGQYYRELEREAVEKLTKSGEAPAPETLTGLFTKPSSDGRTN